MITPASARYQQDPDLLMQFGNHPLTTEAQRAQMKAMFARYKATAFAYSLVELKGRGYYGLQGSMKLLVTSDKTVFHRPRKMSLLEQEISNRKCAEMLEAGIIEPAPTSRYASCPNIVAKI